MPRPCERQCEQCGHRFHFSRFHKKSTGDGTVARFSPICKACEQINRDEEKNADRPLWIIKQRAKAAARKWGVKFYVMWVVMNYEALVEEYRGLWMGLATGKSKCRSCGHKFKDEDDIQIEHSLPPRKEKGEHDWANLHARVLHFLCGSCNNTKGKKTYQDWADEQEAARLSNLKDQSEVSWNDLFDGWKKITIH